MLSFEEIKELIVTVSENRMEKIEIERSGFRLNIVARSAPTVVAAATGAAPQVAQEAAAVLPEAAPSESAAPASQDDSSSVPADSHLVKSPIVGTFYTSPSPESDPYVRPGDRVKKGQVLCIVEAMKLMNEIESDVSGVVLEVYPQNAQPVEFGESLFAIDAD